MRIFEVSKTFPKDEKYALTDQIRRSSRSVCANLAEAWRKRRYEAAFISKLSDSEVELAETQVWLEFAVNCGYMTLGDGFRCIEPMKRFLHHCGMINHPEHGD